MANMAMEDTPSWIVFLREKISISNGIMTGDALYLWKSIEMMIARYDGFFSNGASP